jgi:hypothetical protein
MWDPRLKYRLEVQGRSPSDVVISTSFSFRGSSPRGIPVVSLAGSACMDDTFSLVGVT